MEALRFPNESQVNHREGSMTQLRDGIGSGPCHAVDLSSASSQSQFLNPDKRSLNITFVPSHSNF